MIERSLKVSDLPQIDALWNKYHKGDLGIPARKFLITDVVIENGHLIGYGMTRMFAEALMFLDKGHSKFEQAKAFKLMMDKAIRDCKRFGLDELNVGVLDDHFKSILMDKYGMKDRGPVLHLGL